MSTSLVLLTVTAGAGLALALSASALASTRPIAPAPSRTDVTLTSARRTNATFTDATLTVVLTGMREPRGTLGVAVFPSATGFPDAPTPLQQMHPRVPAAVADTFVFRAVTPGRYAIAAQHDLNGNGVVDRNMVGIPKEPWGVSRDIRHALRAPRFDEAAFDLRRDTTIVVRVSK